MKMLTFIVMGEETTVEVEDDVEIFHARLKALRVTGNLGRPPADFQIRAPNGVLVDPLMPVSVLVSGALFYLSPNIGFSG